MRLILKTLLAESRGCVASLRSAYNLVMDTQGIDRSGALDIMHRQEFMFNPALENERKHHYFMASKDLRDWILFGTLISLGLGHS